MTIRILTSSGMKRLPKYTVEHRARSNSRSWVTVYRSNRKVDAICTARGSAQYFYNDYRVRAGGKTVFQVNKRYPGVE